MPELATTDLRSFPIYRRSMTNRRGEPVAPKTVRNSWAALASFYRWRAEELEQVNPMKGVPKPQVQPPVIDPLDREELATLLKACDQTRLAQTVGRQRFAMKRDTALRDRAIIMTLLDTGLRATECTNLRVKDVELTSGKVYVHLGKGRKDRLVYLGKESRRILWRYLKTRGRFGENEPLFLSRRGGKARPRAIAEAFA
ncbi:MAG TPA: tyrosine-type recombinase/integrase [Chloroflexota bacterium]|nr:tyrosine-type recombinase/integrase [Chloroflexota bacterium]